MFQNVLSAPRVAIVVLALTILRASAEEVRFDLTTASVADIQQAVDAGALTYERLVERYLARIAAYDDAGPKFNAILEIHPRALEIARALDEEYRTSGRRSPLHGIPIVVKDTVDVHDLPSAGGNVGLAGTFPDHDATIVRKLRDAGAIILAKGNLDEFNLGSEGISSIGGQTANPYDPTRNPGGSSSGPAVAVNVGFATLGIATETGASIRSPASNNSLVGIAPSQGLVSRAGIIVISFSHDRAGPHAKSVADAALLLSHMRGLDPDDLMTHDALGTDRRAPYTEALDPEGLRGMRLGVLEDLFREGEDFAPVNEQIRGEIERMREAGAVVVPGLTLGMDLVGFFPQIRHSVPEFRAGFDAYLRRRGESSPFRTLDELHESGRYLEDLEWSFRRTLPTAELEWDPEYLARLKNRRTLRDLLTELMDRHQLDALVYPFKSLTAPPLGTGDRGPRDNPVSSGTGLPAIVLPAGVAADGLPISVELLGRRFDERKLVRIASGYEAVSGHRLAPSSAPPLPGDRFSYSIPDPGEPVQ
ncbi:MAG: amidase family protein [Pseudomonadales bacterium]|jgi:Asp-tRNA(Asn)/Glu-tRNA(Gln) amidotransferase A subunit family amidase|nr:amidase family protein [Pseudomonadales bacterium]